MEAARVLAIRGHEVTLYEKADRLGGQLNLACLPPGKTELKEIIRYYTRQLEILGVGVILSKEVTILVVKEGSPDVVIVAAGSIPLMPDIPGIERDNVVGAEDVLLGKASVGKKVIIVGGALVGCDMAHFLAEKGKAVAIVRRSEEIGRELSASFKSWTLGRLKELGVEMLPGVNYDEAREEGLVITKDGEKQLLEADTIVSAVGYQPNQSLHKELEGKVSELYLIGDCKEPRSIFEAIHEGFQIALSV